jgi:capsular polysaccharide biosynthesis protein
MTFELLRTKLIKNSWVILIAVVITNLSLLANTYNPTYLSSVTVGLSINNPQYQNSLASSNNFAANTYDQTLAELGLYLSNRFAAPDIQYEISENAKLGEKIDNKKPFYEIKNQNGGFVNITYTAVSKSTGENFINSVNNTFLTKIVTEWNKDRPQVFAVDQTSKNKIDFNNSIVEVKPPLQNKLLPTIAGILLGVLLALILPSIKNKHKPSLK